MTITVQTHAQRCQRCLAVIVITLLLFIFRFSVFSVVCAAEPQRSLGSAQTEFFGLVAQGNKFVYVLDRSDSMGDNHETKMKAAKDELLKSLQGLDERQQFYIISYNETPRLFDPGISKGRLVFATDDNKRRAEQFVAGVHPDGGTNHMAALTAALRLRPDVIFLLTDGEAKDDLSADDLKRIDATNGGSAIINVIQFAPEPRPSSSLVELAHQNRGQQVFVDVNKLGNEKQPAVK
jgi:von Willebrand factor type A domain